MIFSIVRVFYTCSKKYVLVLEKDINIMSSWSDTKFRRWLLWSLIDALKFVLIIIFMGLFGNSHILTTKFLLAMIITGFIVYPVVNLFLKKQIPAQSAVKRGNYIINYCVIFAIAFACLYFWGDGGLWHLPVFWGALLVSLFWIAIGQFVMLLQKRKLL